MRLHSGETVKDLIWYYDEPLRAAVRSAEPARAAAFSPEAVLPRWRALLDEVA